MRLAGVAMLMLPIYGVLSWGSESPAAAPVQAVKSGISPNETDRSSNDCRKEENANLKFTALESPVLGVGFGKPMIMHKPLPDISDVFPWYKYQSHNGILWLFMTVGLLGSLAFWYFIGAAVTGGVKAAQFISNEDGRTVIAFALVTVAAFLAFGLLDQGLLS